MTRRRQPNPPAGSRRGTRGKRTINLAWLWATLGALGVLSAIGGYYVPGILKSGGEVVTNRAPLDYDIAPGREGTPTFVFPTSSKPSSVPLDILEGSPMSFASWARRQGGVRAGADAAYRFRYTDLRLLDHVGGKYFLVSDGWTPHYGVVIVLAETDPVRLEFVRDWRRPAQQPTTRG